MSTNLYLNISRTLTSLEKSLDRLARAYFYNRSQYPDMILAIESALRELRAWIKYYRKYDQLNSFYGLVAQFIKEIGMIINKLWGILKAQQGKRETSKKDKEQQQNKIIETLESILTRINKFIENAPKKVNKMTEELDSAIATLFDEKIIQNFRNQIEQIKDNPVSQRGQKTYIFPCADKSYYLDLVKNAERFRSEVVKNLERRCCEIGHKPSCKCDYPKSYRLCGFRANSRKTILSSKEKEIFPIRIIECVDCGQKFSLLPSFLPREKNFGIDIIENVCEGLFLFQHSLQGVLRNHKFTGIKSKQTLYNWIRWVGIYHPAAILTRAGVEGSGYFQEDEGFEKEPNLRTYVVVIVDPKSHLVWHADYMDHVDEDSLYSSFEEFAKRISFKVLGVVKDKWQASTNALRRVFYKLWIGYCHRHCLKKFREALNEYQKDSKCSQIEITRLYKKFKKLLKTSCSKRNLEMRIESLNDEAFNHPALKKRLDELKNNAVHYTAHKNRQDISETTSIVDNYLKLIKRKLRQVESFRDKDWGELFFRAQANTRNFVPYNSGAKNAHKSPFMLAGGEHYDLPGFQVMNIHNAFLFAD